MFTTRHYRAIAAVIRALPLNDGELLTVVNRFADRFAADNPRFNRRLFLIACDAVDEPSICGGTGNHDGQSIESCDECAENGPWNAGQ